MRDYRLFERFEARFPVKLKHSRGDYGTELFLRDASAQGMRVTSRQKMFLNDSVSLLVRMTDGKTPLNLNGRVVWIKTLAENLWDVGLEFHKIDFMKTHRLYELVNAAD